MAQNPAKRLHLSPDEDPEKHPKKVARTEDPEMSKDDPRDDSSDSRFSVIYVKGCPFL